MLFREDERPRNIYSAGQIIVMGLWEPCRSYAGAEGSLKRAREDSGDVELFCPRVGVGRRGIYTVLDLHTIRELMEVDAGRQDFETAKLHEL